MIITLHNGRRMSGVNEDVMARAASEGIRLDCRKERVYLPFVDPNSGLNYYEQDICGTQGTPAGFDPDLINRPGGWEIFKLDLAREMAANYGPAEQQNYFTSPTGGNQPWIIDQTERATAQPVSFVPTVQAETKSTAPATTAAPTTSSSSSSAGSSVTTGSGSTTSSQPPISQTAVQATTTTPGMQWVSQLFSQISSAGLKPGATKELDWLDQVRSLPWWVWAAIAGVLLYRRSQ